MTLRSVVKTAVSMTAHRTGLTRLLARRYRGRGMIFALHSVVDENRFYPDHTLRCSVRRLDWTLQWLRQQGFEFVSLNEAVRRLSEPTSRPFAAFTFDDGYADNLTHALPVMRRHEAPFTVYVTTGMITREIDGWWFGLAELVRSQSQVVLPALRWRFDCSNPRSKQRAFQLMEAAIHRDFSVLPHVRSAIEEKKISTESLVDREALNEQQLWQLANDRLVSIGGHTTTHQNLAKASAPAVQWEMAENRKFLEGQIQRRVEHFAYPFGHARACGAREAAIAKSVGFRTATTTRLGALFPGHADHLHALPRIHLAEDETRSTLRCKVDGFYRMVQSRFGDPVACM